MYWVPICADNATRAGWLLLSDQIKRRNRPKSALAPQPVQDASFCPVKSKDVAGQICAGTATRASWHLSPIHGRSARHCSQRHASSISRLYSHIFEQSPISNSPLHPVSPQINFIPQPYYSEEPLDAERHGDRKYSTREAVRPWICRWS
jgi:hypothetical protein